MNFPEERIYELDTPAVITREGYAIKLCEVNMKNLCLIVGVYKCLTLLNTFEDYEASYEQMRSNYLGSVILENKQERILEPLKMAQKHWRGIKKSITKEVRYFIEKQWGRYLYHQGVFKKAKLELNGYNLKLSYANRVKNIDIRKTAEYGICSKPHCFIRNPQFYSYGISVDTRKNYGIIIDYSEILFNGQSPYFKSLFKNIKLKNNIN